MTNKQKLQEILDSLVEEAYKSFKEYSQRSVGTSEYELAVYKTKDYLKHAAYTRQAMKD